MVLKASLCMYDMVVCFRIPEVIVCFYAKICFGMHSIFDAVKGRSDIAYHFTKSIYFKSWISWISGHARACSLAILCKRIRKI